MAGAGPIPRTAVSDFIETEGIIDARGFRDLIRSLDAVYLEVSGDKAKAGAASNAGPP